MIVFLVIVAGALVQAAFEEGSYDPLCNGPFPRGIAPIFIHKDCHKYWECDIRGFFVEKICGPGTRFIYQEPQSGYCAHLHEYPC